MSHIQNNNDLHALDDQCLVARIQSGAEGRGLAFSILIGRHQDRLLRHCLVRLGCRHDAEDALQETVLRAYRGIGGFKGDSSFRTWLHAIADNQCNSLAVRRSKQIMSGHLRELIRYHESERLEWEKPQSEETISRKVHQTLTGLPAGSRDVLMLRFYSDLRIEQIAHLLGIGISAAKMRLYRAQTQFSECFSDKLAA